MAAAGKGAGARRTTAAIVLGAAVLIAAAAPFLGMRGSRKGHDLYSSLSPAPDGTKALWTLLGDLGFETKRIMEPTGGETLRGTDVLLIVQPMSPLKEEEGAEIGRWVEGGGTVILAGTLPIGSLLAVPQPPPDDSLDYHDPLDAGDHDPEETNAEPGASAGDGWSQIESGARVAILRDVETIEYSGLLGGEPVKIEVEKDAKSRKSGANEVLVSRGGISFVEVTEKGAGRIVKIRAAEPFLNSNVEKGRNLTLLLNVLEEHGGKGRIAFDEAHRKLAPGEQPAVWDVLGEEARAAFSQILVAAAAALVAIGWRRAPAMQETRARRRRVLEQVEALAGLMERAGAAGLAVRLLHGRTERLWAEGRLAPPATRDAAGAARRQEETFAEMAGIAGKASARDKGGIRASDLARYVDLGRKLRRAAARRRT